MGSCCGFVVAMIVKDNRVAPLRRGATRCVYLKAQRLELNAEYDRYPVS